ncbi:MAG: Bro-N domain-containing protein [Bacteroidota bacterium]|nr:Bro-N domain-containing protein [Bacteroidota bacterium]
MSNIKLFESKKVRTHWDEEKETWYFAIVDVIAILTESENPQVYWRVMKKRLLAEGNETVTNCNALKMEAPDGKMRMTDVADTKQLLRLIQSIPSPKAEPFKLWLAKVGYERMQEIQDPEMSLDRARENWQKLGRSEKWIQQRMTGQETRNKLTDYWKESGVQKSDEFAFLTNIIHQEWTGILQLKIGNNLAINSNKIMAKTFQRTKPTASLSEFLEKASKVKSFTSSNGRRYEVVRNENDKMYFLRLDAKPTEEWNMNLKEVYRAYEELDDFATKNFKPCVPITHSPARGLLLHLGMLE